VTLTPYWTGWILFASGLIGGILAVTAKERVNRLGFSWILTFCGGLLFSTAILHLLPLVQSFGHHRENLWLLGGFFLQLILEKFSAGVEHGHLHSGHDHRCDHPIHPESHPSGSSRPTKAKAWYYFAGIAQNARYWGLMMSLTLHGLIEGIPLTQVQGPTHDHRGWSPLLLGIVLHKAPTTFALGALMVHQQFKSWTLWLSIIWVAAMTPLGLLGGGLLGQSAQGNLEILHALMALATGSFLQIASTILFESSLNHRFNWKQLSGALLGAYLAYFLGH